MLNLLCYKLDVEYLSYVLSGLFICDKKSYLIKHNSWIHHRGRPPIYMIIPF